MEETTEETTEELEDVVSSPGFLHLSADAVDDFEHIRVEVVYDRETATYEVGKCEGGLDFRFPVLTDAGDFFVRVLGVDVVDNAEVKTLIVKVT
jgi:hypothetical protein